ncbi:hypothetical protein UA08_01929 [Talaromyces atroroseus]|uniref:Ras-GEF domain-containing protein n=1 Tax=Talaromyces atroroseus TaxID=1441469 RepID=A0A1Q5QCH8_TALAT|nr:hypothetical protein UA08_01929 [Talaromyces atroroseus]OKL63559.1 hypothetical protein UA08_01929 [Talaromyces atroroseus]
MMTAAPDDLWAVHPTTISVSPLAETALIPSSQVYSPVSPFGPELSGSVMAATTSTSAPFGSAEIISHGDGSEHASTNMAQPIAQHSNSYPLLFRTASEIPRFSVPYRWWEDDARTILWSFDVRQISLVIRFSLFHDSNQPRAALQRRDSSFLDTFLATVLQPYELPFIHTLSQTQKIDEILRRSQNTMSVNPPWSWHPAQDLRGPEPATIAQEIEAESQLHFKAVPFEAWVRCSLGFPAAEVDWFLLQHNALYIILLTHLKAHQYDIIKYRKVEKLLRGKSPLAHKAVVHSLSQFQNGKDAQIPQTNTPSLDFIVGPIQELFKRYPANLVSTLKTLSVVAIRFQKTQIHVPNVDWYKKLDTRVPFLDNLLASLSATELARSLNRADQSMFSQLSPEQLMNEQSPIIEALHTRWCDLVVAVWECCTALPDHVPWIQECIEILHSLHNYNSTLALIQGLNRISMSFLWSNLAPNNDQHGQTANALSLAPASVSYLLDSSNNYAAYRQAMKITPGIPFLLPHVIEYRQHGKAALDELFITT